MLKVVECIYRTTEKPENPEKYQKLQVLAQIKIDMVWNDNTELQSAIDKVENYLVYDEPCNIEEMKKLAEMTKSSRTEALKDKKYTDKFTKELKDELLQKDKPEQFHVVKGAIELGNTIGSVLGLALFAPEVSHLNVHPIMKFMGIEKKSEG